VIDAGQIVDTLGGLADQRQGFFVENRALVDLDRHDDRIGAAETLFHAVVNLDIRMLLRQKIVEIAIDLQLGYLPGKRRGNHAHDREHGFWIGEQPIFATMQYACQPASKP
jgi:hypothetical protein